MKITKLSRRQTQIIVITAGLLLFLITIVYSVKTDIKAVARQMDETLKYVKEQCYIYNRYNEASQQEEARWHQLLNAHRTRKILPYCDEQFDEYRDNSVQEFRFVLSQGIREQIFYASFVKNIEKHIKSNHTINALKQVIRYQGYHL